MLLLTVSLLVLPLLNTLAYPTPQEGWAKGQATKAVKIAFLISLPPLLLFVNEGLETATVT